MAISAKEKKLIAGAMAAGAVGIVFLLVMPAIDAMNALNASITAKDTEITTQNSALQAKKQELGQKQANQQLPEDINIRVFEAESFDKNVKLMLDTIIQAVTKSNNRLIKLEPTSKQGDLNDTSTGTLSNPNPTTPALDPNAVPGATGGPPATPPADGAVPPAPAPVATGPDPNAAVPNILGANTNSTGSLGNQIQYFAYTLTIRGTYDSLMDFIGDLSNNPELIEISSIAMKNEVGPERVKGKEGGTVDVMQIPGEEQEQEEQNQEKALVDPAKPIRLTLKMKLLLIPKPGSASSMAMSAPMGTQASLPSAPGGTP
jgi:hypothetical protein